MYDFAVYYTKGVENYSKKINLLKREWVFLCPKVKLIIRINFFNDWTLVTYVF